MRTGILGGTFNPVHKGHVKLAQTCVEGLRLEQLLVIPTYIPPHKAARGLVSGEHRMEMCRLAFEGCAICDVNDLELRRGRRSYTVETLRELHAHNPNLEPFLLMGSDMLLTFRQWYRWEEILKLTAICACSRENKGEDTALLAEQETLKRYGARCHILKTDPLVISSTELRKKIAAGEDVSTWIPSGVCDYIARHRLYIKK